jgi:hypothetical protein
MAATDQPAGERASGGRARAAVAPDRARHRPARRHRYPKAIKALRRLREGYELAGDAAGFGVYLDGLRERQRRKYSFIAKLDAKFGTEGSYALRVKNKVGNNNNNNSQCEAS